MNKILPLQPHQIPQAKKVIAQVAGRIYAPDQPCKDFAGELVEEHELEEDEISLEIQLKL
jgi:hypothetical protein